MNNELWYFLIGGQKDNETGLYGNFYAYGKYLGDALRNTFNASTELNFNAPYLMEASLLNEFDEIENNNELVQLSELVYSRQQIHSFPLNDPDKDFIPPTGIVKDVADDELEYELIKENFVAFDKDENGIYQFELVLGKESLIVVFLKLIEILPTINGFWIYIKDFWEDENEELWVAKHFTDKHSIVNFLTSGKINTLENGYLDLVVHSLTGETNLMLDEHKKINLHTKNEDVFKSIIGQVLDFGYEQTTEELYNLEFGFRHWHYRPSDSLNREEFKAMLASRDFEQLD